MRNLFLLLLFQLILTPLFAQVTPGLISNVVIKGDTTSYSLKENTTIWKDQPYMYFRVSENREFVTVQLFPEKNIFFRHIRITASPDYDVIDSMKITADSSWFGRIRFEDLLYGPNPRLSFFVTLKDSTIKPLTVDILPVFNTEISNPDKLVELFQEEEKTIEIPTTDAFDIRTDNIWTVTNDYDYKISTGPGVLQVTIKPHTLGYRQFTIPLTTFKPVYNKGKITNQLEPVLIRFNVKPNQLYFINVDQNTIYIDEEVRTWHDIQIDYNPNLSIKKTYRIEDQQEEGGNLIAELFTVSVIANTNKVLCRLKPYSIHRKSDGYLYIKEGNRARFVTNFNILEKPKIQKVSVMREGQIWTSDLSIYPGETVQVKIEGKGLLNASFHFEGCTESRDTTKYSDNIVFYTVSVPMGITFRVINITMNKEPTSFDLYVKEYQNPAKLDFVSISYGPYEVPLTNDKLNRPLFYDNVIQDINLIFHPEKIDTDHKLYGKQYLDVQVKIFNSKNDLIEIQDINNLIICPGPNSPRYPFYNLKDCNNGAISLNEYLIHKTYKLEPFSQIEITVKDDPTVYSGTGQSKKIRIILTRQVHFDIQVSFPAGLLVKRFDESGYGNLSGISTSILAQLNFYNPKVIGELRPYNIGAGFIALNAFNFSSSPNNIRDVGVVILGSLNPVRKSTKFSLPIYLGGGYLLKTNTWFLVFGPGIQFNF